MTAYVFGGYGKDNFQTNDVHVFDSGKHTRSKPMVKGIPPSPRDSHSCTTVGTHLFVFGGTDGKNPLRDLHMLETTTNTWVQPNVSGEGPTAREEHNAALIDQRLFIFGGCGKAQDESEEIYSNDLYILDTATNTWVQPNVSGEGPAACEEHSAALIEQHLFIFGGCGKAQDEPEEIYQNDLYILDTATNTWVQPNVSGEGPTAREEHSAALIDQRLFIFGGCGKAQDEYEEIYYNDLYILDTESAMVKTYLDNTEMA